MKRKLYAVTLIVTIVSTLLAGAITVSAADICPGWTYTYYEGAYDAEASYAEVSTTEYYEGGSALHVKNTEGNSFHITPSLTQPLSSATFEITFYVKSTADSTPELVLEAGWNESNNKNISNLTPEATERDGWVKYTTTIGSAEKKLDLFVSGDTEYYLDNFVMMPQVTNINWVSNSTFDNGEALPSTGEQETVDSWNVAFEGSKGFHSEYRYAKVSEDEYYEGNASLHIKTTDDGQIRLSNSSFYSLDNTTYDISFYLKGSVTDEGQWASFTAMAGWSTGVNHFPLTAMTAEATEKDGWIKYSAQISSPETAFTIFVGCPVDCYIDGFSAKIVDTDEELVTNGGFNVEEEVFTIPDLTEKTFVGGDSWVLWDDFESGTYKLANSTLNASKGKYSLHVKLTDTASGPLGQIQTKILPKNVSYTISLSVRDGSVIDGMHLQVNWDNVRLAECQSQPDEKEGWTRYTWTETLTEKDRIYITCFGGLIDAYIDDLVITADGSDVDELGGAGNFELTPSGTYEVTSVRLFDSQKIEIADVPTVGSAFTAAVAVTNFDVADDFQAQLIVTVCDGKVLKKVALSDVNVITSADSGKIITCDMEMPQEAPKSEYKIKAFVWDSITGMRALADVSTF